MLMYGIQMGDGEGRDDGEAQSERETARLR